MASISSRPTVSLGARLLRVCTGTAALVLIAGTARVGADTTLTTALRPAGTCVEAGGADSGTQIWNNEASARVADNVRAETLAMAGGQGSLYLACSNYGFTIPAGCPISGVEMITERKHLQSADSIGDRHVYLIRSDGAGIGSTGVATDRQRPCASNDWMASTNAGTDFTSAPYGGPSDLWGINWGACRLPATTCAAGEFNLNHPTFGAAMAAQNCGMSAGTAQVDSVGIRVTYTIPSCSAANQWVVTSVTPTDKTPGATTSYTIVAAIPNRGGCALTSASQITVAFDPNTDTSGVTAAGSSFKVTGPGAATPITPTAPAPQTVRFTVPAAALRPCEGQPQGCLEQNTSVTFVVNGIRNPTTDGNYKVTLSATPTLDGSTGATASSTFVIAADCTAASAWGTPTVTLSDAQASLAAGATTLACPIYAKYTIDTTVPAPGGCKLIGGTSKLIVQFPTGSEAAPVRITDAKVNMTSVTPESTADVTLVRLPVPMDVGNGQPVKIELTVVKNPEMDGAKVLTVSATSPFFSSTGTTAATQGTYTIAPQTACPPVDFIVRDWTDVPNVKRDDGAIPSSPNSTGNTIPPNCWAKCSDVWNQGGPTAPAIAFDNFFAGTNLALAGSNNAFTRVTRKSAAPAIPFYRPVTATYFFSAYGLGQNFQLLDSVTTQAVSASDPATILSPLTSWTIPDVPGMPGVKPPLSNPPLHVCLAVQIDAAGDPQKTAGLTTMDRPGPADPLISGDDNKALHNYDLVAMAAPPPPPPPPSPPMGSGPMARFGIVHNAAVKTRDMVIRYQVPRDALEHLRDPEVQVIGGETVPLKPDGTLTLTKMRPGENRWIGLNYTLVSGAENDPLAVSFSETDGNTVMGAFTMGIQVAPIDVVVRRNLGMHSSVFARMARVFGVPQGKEESAAADALLKQTTIPEDRYVAHLQKHRASIDSGVSRLLKSDGGRDPFGVAAALRNFDERLGSKGTSEIANAHLALLEKLDALQTMRDMAKGDPADVLQMVRWQKELYATVPQLRDLDVAANVAKESDAFIAGYATAKPGAYAEHITKLMKSFGATAAALRKSGVDLSGELTQLERSRRSVASLQKAHRDLLLKLDDLAGSPASPPTAQQRS